MTAKPSLVKDLSLIIGMVSCKKYENRVQSCVSTWVPDVTEVPNIRVIQVLGNPDQKNLFDYDADIGRLSLKCPDTYQALSRKSQLFFEWVLKNTKATHVFKCDDDTYVNVPKFLELDLTDKAYMGFPMEKKELDFRYGSGGAGYFLNRDSMQAVVDSKEFADEPYEDLGVGKTLNKAGIALSHSHMLIPGLNFWSNDFIPFEDEKLPSEIFIKKHATIHLHRMSPESMFEVHNIAKRPG